MTTDTIARLRGSRRIWAIAAVHGVASRLAALAARIVPRLQPRDAIVFMGNLVGGPPGGEPADIVATLDIALALRRTVLARPGARACDVVFLRGAQEEMWSKLDQLHFAVNPRDVLRWMLHHGVGATIESYAGPDAIAEGLRAVGAGPMMASRWTTSLRQAVRAHPGHEPLYTAVKRAALSEDGRLLFVNHGVDPTRPLDRQGDNFWWGAAQPFERIAGPFDGVERAVRGFDRAHPGVVSGAVGMTIDGGCGFGGPLLALLLDRDGRELERISA
jgi:serine/threonine protein phosphatase 1